MCALQRTEELSREPGSHTLLDFWSEFMVRYQCNVHDAQDSLEVFARLLSELPDGSVEQTPWSKTLSMKRMAYLVRHCTCNCGIVPDLVPPQERMEWYLEVRVSSSDAADS